MALIAGIGDDAAKRGAGCGLDVRDCAFERVSVIWRSRQSLGVKDELAASCGATVVARLTLTPNS